MCGIYIGLALLAFCFIAIFLDKIDLDKNKSTKKDNKITFDLLMATFKHWKASPSQQLITILTIYSGIEQAFITSDFTKVRRILHVYGYDLRYIVILKYIQVKI